MWKIEMFFFNRPKHFTFSKCFFCSKNVNIQWCKWLTRKDRELSRIITIYSWSFCIMNEKKSCWKLLMIQRYTVKLRSTRFVSFLFSFSIRVFNDNHVNSVKEFRIISSCECDEQSTEIWVNFIWLFFLWREKQMFLSLVLSKLNIVADKLSLK